MRGHRLSLLVVSVCAVVASRVYEVANDDAFITFVSARNFAAGHGLVFWPGDAVLSTTSPLWALLLGIGAFVTGLETAELARWGAIAALAGASLFLGELIRPPLGAIAAAAVAPPLFFGWSMRWTTGNETALLYLAVSACVWASASGRVRLALALAAAATFIRGEAILLLLIVIIMARVRRRPVRLMDVVPALAILTAGGVALWSLYGTVIPNTLVTKTLERHTAGFVAELPQMIGWIYASAGAAWLAAGIALAGTVYACRKLPTEIVLWPLYHVAGYSLLGAGSHAWYYHSIGWLWAIGVASAAGLGATAMAAWRPVLAPAALALAIAGLPTLREWTREHAFEFARFDTYRETAAFLDARMRTDDAVAAEEIGVLQYYLPHRVIAPDFLVHTRPSDVAPLYRQGWLLTGLRPRFFVMAAPDDRLLPDAMQYDFEGRESVHYRFQDVVDAGGYPVRVYERVDGVGPGSP